MPNVSYSDLLTEREAAVAFNLGLKTAVYMLEMAEHLSPEGRRCLIDELKKHVADRENDYAVEFLRDMQESDHRGFH